MMQPVKWLHNFDWKHPVDTIITGLQQLETYVSEKVLKGWSPADVPNLSGPSTWRERHLLMSTFWQGHASECCANALSAGAKLCQHILHSFDHKLVDCQLG
jgi:hypothetical protein